VSTKINEQPETRTYYERLHAEANTRVSVVMTSRGFVSVFEYIRKAAAGAQVFTLWLNMTTGKEMLTIVDERGCYSYRELWPALCFDKGQHANA
jgi:ribosomal protein S8